MIVNGLWPRGFKPLQLNFWRLPDGTQKVGRKRTILVKLLLALWDESYYGRPVQLKNRCKYLAATGAIAKRAAGFLLMFFMVTG